jgi:acetyl-CoA carboxylase beta subunit
MRPEEAKEYGLIDDIIQRHETAEEIHELVQFKLERDPKLDTKAGEKAADKANA